MRGVLHSLRRRGWGPRLCNLQAHGAAWRTGSSPPPGGRGGGRRIFLPARAWCPGAVPSGRGVAGLRASRYPGQTVSPGAGEGGEVDGPEHLGPALRLGARSPRPPKDAAAGGQVGRPWRALWLAEADEEGPGRRSPGLGRAGGGGSHPSLGRQDGGGAPPWTYLPSPGGAEAASLGTAPISFLSSPSPWSQSGEEAWRGGLSSLGTWSSGFRGRPDVGCTCGRRAPASPSRLRILSPPGAQEPRSLIQSGPPASLVLLGLSPPWWRLPTSSPPTAPQVHLRKELVEICPTSVGLRGLGSQIPRWRDETLGARPLLFWKAQFPIPIP
ncbi:galactoside alpha-(1,2)-fucosyltransferase 1 isoform X4 [Ailuropoda melanoleuca]|uniref:galactoside alpha-(1,2)-fucosyltransferase 1 isoform X4 n=1 Tax=Ailuropoda melanoleuca TaxID=9646 RepID=UPI00149456E8|nr:galactoside alpha-(1,2)-fucosyltransferase 1 isoform X4 [Ailuropoda melanoleuca]